MADGKLSIIGASNMDYNSFELNFEVNVLLCHKPIAGKLSQVFFTEQETAEKIDTELWCRRPAYEQLPEKPARLFSPVL